jgi:predicted O-linked N-acetylglucosamine transferase (SPINDLY family)
MVRKLLNCLVSIVRAPGSGARSPVSPREAADRLIAEGNRAEDAGKVEEACERYREAVRAVPGYAKAHLNLGIGLEAVGDAGRALKAYEAALVIDPAEPYANYNLGKLLHMRDKPAQAERLLRQALRSRPEFPEARIVLASVLQAQGALEDAAAELEAALKLRPDDFGALYRYAGVLGQLERLDEAQAALRRAIAIDPENTDASYDLATMLIARNEPGQAAPLLRAVLARKPGFVEAGAALFHVLSAQGDLGGAAVELEMVLKQRPDWADAHYNYGLVLKKLKRLGESESAFRRAIVADPGHCHAYRMLGSVMLGQCRTEEALALYRTARERCPGDFDLASAELFALNSSEQISDDALFAKHVAFGARIEKAHPPRFQPFRNIRDSGRRLRIGYVSGDFCYHVVTLFMIPVLERRDRSAYEVFCYSIGDGVDGYTRQLAERADVWREAASMSVLELADLINRDGIDILVDLAGHSGIPQLAVFAQQPAPVQATWLGYLNTTGMTRIQYRISDRHSDPPRLTDPYHTETLVRLPHSQWCYRPFISAACAETPPFMRNGYVTFGSFNQALKLSRAVRALWSEILKRLPDSRLLILGIEKGRAQDDLLADLATAGVDAARITILPYVSLQDYFRWVDSVDIALDTTPYSGGTTTCDALWMGVPVVTAPGSRPSSRSAASILMTVGLAEWVASTAEEYVGRAVEFAGKHEVLAELRASLRSRMRASPLMDEERFTRDLESLYRQVWREWCDK